MGYYVNTIDCNIFLDKQHFNAVYEKMCELNNYDELKRGGSFPPAEHNEKYNPNKWFSWMPYNYPDECVDMLHIFSMLGFDYEIDYNGNLIGLHYDYNKTGQEDYFLCCLAGYVKPGSYLTFKGEDDDHYRFYFDETTMSLQRGIIDVNYITTETYAFAKMSSQDEYLANYRNQLQSEIANKSQS